MPAGRRLRAVLNPGIERVEQAAEQRAVVAGISQVFGDAATGRVAGRAVLRAAKGIDANLGRFRHVFRAQAIGMNQ
jgi:hypothetical protein